MKKIDPPPRGHNCSGIYESTYVKFYDVRQTSHVQDHEFFINLLTTHLKYNQSVLNIPKILSSLFLIILAIESFYF